MVDALLAGAWPLLELFPLIIFYIYHSFFRALLLSQCCNEKTSKLNVLKKKKGAYLIAAASSDLLPFYFCSLQSIVNQVHAGGNKQVKAITAVSGDVFVFLQK